MLQGKMVRLLVALLDLKSAFDSVNRRLLIESSVRNRLAVLFCSTNRSYAYQEGEVCCEGYGKIF